MTTEAQKLSHKKWVDKNRDALYEYNRNWRQNNKKKWNESTLKYRKRKAQEMKEKGMMFVYLTRSQRELRSIRYLSKKLNISEEEARELLTKADWNVKSLLPTKENHLK